ncbi:hypothetical protein [Coleofasciculus chthonoplastes]
MSHPNRSVFVVAARQSTEQDAIAAKAFKSQIESNPKQRSQKFN